MRTHRLTAVAVLALTIGAVLPAPASAAAEVFIEANPNTVEAGGSVGLRGSCDDNTRPATVDSAAFPDVVLQPQFGFLTGQVTVPADQAADDYEVRLRCPGGGTSTTVLHVLNRNRPSRGPATGFGGTADSGSARLLLLGGGALIVAALGLLVFGARRRTSG